MVPVMSETTRLERYGIIGCYLELYLRCLISAAAAMFVVINVHDSGAVAAKRRKFDAKEIYRICFAGRM